MRAAALSAAVLALFALAGCASKPHRTPMQHPELFDFQPGGTTTTVPAVVVPATVAPPVTTTLQPEPEVVPLAESEPVPQSSGRLGDPYYEPTWHALRQCEAPDWAGDWQANTGNGYYGGLQFSLRSWRWVGGAGYPHEASVAEQIRRGQMLWERQGWGAWPACSRKLGWR